MNTGLRSIFQAGLLFWITTILCASHAIGQDVTINAEIKNRQHDTFLLAQVYGDNQFVIDSAFHLGSDKFEFVISDSSFKRGLYYVIALPDKSFFQLLVDDRKAFSFKMETGKEVETMRFKGSKQNEKFYDYLRFLNSLREDQSALETQDISEAEKKQLAIEIENKVRDYQDDLVAQNEGTLLALMVGNARNVIVPEFEDAENPAYARFWYYQDHYFDLMNLSDERNIFTPNFYSKLSDFINKYTIQEADSIIAHLDIVFDGIEGNEPAQRFVAAKFLNAYARSKIIGMDAVYVYIADRFYSTADNSWLEEEARLKIVDNANFFRPNLIGNKAPALKLLLKDNSQPSLYDLNSKYTVLMFWSPSCSHCKAEMPKLEELSNKLQEYDAQIVTICTKGKEECWEYVDEVNIGGSWIKALPTSDYYRKYDIRSTPKLYLLDADHKIIFKSFALTNLPAILDRFQELEAQKSSDGR